MAKHVACVFKDNFCTCADREHPGDWLVERHTDRAHRHGWVEGGAYHILCRGNKHIPLTPPLKDFTLTFQCRGDEGARGAGCYIFFHYDSDQQAGYYIKRQWEASGGATQWGVCAGDGDQLIATQSDKDAGALRPVHEWNEIRLEVRSNCFAVFHNDAPVGRFKDAQVRYPGAGSIAFDRDRPTEPGARGPFFLRRVVIRSRAAPAPARLWKPICIEFPAGHNGIVSPVYYRLEAVKYANHVQIRMRLTGGPAGRERRDAVLLRYRSPNSLRWQNERLFNPYLRLERPGGGNIGTYYLFRGTVGLKEHWDRRAPGLPPADIEYPVERVIRLPSLPPNPNVFIGYDFYEAEERSWMKGGPTEAWVDPVRGKVISSGAPLKASGVFVDISSPANKAIVKLIPAHEPRRAKALAFARANHYFMERERVCFTALVRHRLADIAGDGLRAEWVLEDAFRQPIKPARRCLLRTTGDAEARRWRDCLGARTLVSALLKPGSLPVGVYHLAVRVCSGTRVLAETRRAFEIMPASPSALSPPLASGLPELLFYESSDFVSAADPFDPWMGRAVDEGHYVSNNGFPAPFAGAHRAWSLVHLYRRKWWLWCNNPEDHPALVRHADLIYAGELERRFDLWLLHTYLRPASPQPSPGAFDALLEFLQSPAFTARGDSRLNSEDIRKAGELSAAQFVALVESHWKLWLKYFNRWYAQIYMQQTAARFREPIANARWGWFAPYPPYGSVYKSAWFPLYMGRDLQSDWARSLKGPMRFESYPYVCGYPVQRDVFQLAAMKLEAPDMRLYPEVYSLTGIPVDLHVLMGSPPYARACPPAKCFRKRFFEYAYAAAWFGSRGFGFWNDNGFQPKHWGQDHFAEFLSAWSVIRRVRPEKPLRTTAFVYSRSACREHPDTLDVYRPRYYQDGHGPGFFGDIFNTAEECVAFAYEQARADGQCAGFIAALDYIGGLSPADVHTLVLPPLVGLTEADRDRIRKAHAAGISLLAFESVPGLEDLFGVAPLRKPVVLGGIRVQAKAARLAPWSEIRDEQEIMRHSLCRAAYRCKEAQAVLEGLDAKGRAIAPALVMHRTRWGRTALFTIPPTVVRRESGDAVITYGKASLSHLINRAMALVLRQMGRPRVETTAGKLIGFRDTRGLARIIVAEDSHPDPALNIEPVVTIRLPRVAPGRIHCDRAYEVVSAAPSCVRLRVPLGEHDCAMITVDA
jgi:hypothetical protein